MDRSHLKYVLLIILLCITASWQIFRPGFFTMHDDLQVMRVFEMDRCLKDGQVPCRWSPDMGAGYGQPMFNFYSATPYYLGGLLKLTGLSFIGTVKALILFAMLLSGLLSFLFFSAFLTPMAALVGSIAYVFIPYRALDIFVRGALSESYALALLPLVLYALFSITRKPSVTKVAFLAVSLGLFFSTHNITTMISAPLFTILTIYFLIKNGFTKRKLLDLFIGTALGFGLAAFFLLPVFLEKDLVHTEFLVSDYYSYQNNFISLKQIFADLRWGFGTENIGPGGPISFFIGFMPLASLLILPLLIFSKKAKEKRAEMLLVWILGLSFLFMVHSRSYFIWRLFPLLSFVQFPWRFLGLFALFSSWSLALIVQHYQKLRWFSVAIIILLFSLNFGYFRFGRSFPAMTDTQKLSGVEFEQQQKAALLDYLPKTSKKVPDTLAPTMPQVINGTVSINYFDDRSGYFSSEFDIYTPTAKVRFPVVYFPGWELHLNRSPQLMAIDIDNDLGLITVELKSGHQLVQGFFENTPSRTVGNLVTFTSALFLISYLLLRQEKDEE